VAHRIPIEASLDLHAFAPRDVKSVVEEYVNAAHEAGLREVRLIHGRGKGVAASSSRRWSGTRSSSNSGTPARRTSAPRSRASRSDRRNRDAVARTGGRFCVVNRHLPSIS
jgi:hypothetical protein